MVEAPPIPTLDLEAFLSGSEGEKKFIETLRQGAVASGFMYCRAHKTPKGLPEEMFAQLRAFARLPMEEKRALFDPAVAGERGYLAFQDEKHMRGEGGGDLKEAISIGRGPTYHGPNRHVLDYPENIWPEIPGFQEVMLEGYCWLDEMKRHFSQALALSLELPNHYFEERFENGDNLLRALHYFGFSPGDEEEREGKPFKLARVNDYDSILLPQNMDTSVLEGAMRTADHMDSNGFTELLLEEDPKQEGKREGLEAKIGGIWYKVTPPSDHLVINIGEMITRVTNGLYKSAEHRVPTPTNPDQLSRNRLAFGYFCHPRKEVPLTILETCTSRDNPQRYADNVPAGVFLMAYLATTGMLGENSHEKFKEMYNGRYFNVVREIEIKLGQGKCR